MSEDRKNIIVQCKCIYSFMDDVENRCAFPKVMPINKMPLAINRYAPFLRHRFSCVSNLHRSAVPIIRAHPSTRFSLASIIRPFRNDRHANCTLRQFGSSIFQKLHFVRFNVVQTQFPGSSRIICIAWFTCGGLYVGIYVASDTIDERQTLQIIQHEYRTGNSTFV